MKPGAGIATLLLSLALLPGELPAGEDGEPAKPAKTRVQMQLHRLIAAEAGIASPAEAVAEVGPETRTEGTWKLEPMVVEAQKLKDLPPAPSDHKVEEFFRTGTIWEKVGRTFTKRFWAKGDEGIMFTLSW